jgi:SecD/SecF fusion protein
MLSVQFKKDLNKDQVAKIKDTIHDKFGHDPTVNSSVASNWSRIG